jgi:hypothetical protein
VDKTEPLKFSKPNLSISIDIAEILLKVALNTINQINLGIKLCIFAAIASWTH